MNTRHYPKTQLTIFTITLVAGIVLLAFQPLPIPETQTDVCYANKVPDIGSKVFQLPPCQFRTLTGLYCPGCGITRSLECLIHGRLSNSLRYNPITIPFLVVMLILIYFYFSELFSGRRPPIIIILSLSVVILTLELILMILRNIPFPALDIIRPPL